MVAKNHPSGALIIKKANLTSTTLGTAGHRSNLGLNSSVISVLSWPFAVLSCRR